VTHRGPFQPPPCCDSVIPQVGKIHPPSPGVTQFFWLWGLTVGELAPHPSAWHRQELMVWRDGGRGVVPQQVSQLGVGAPLPQDHVLPVRQLVQDEVPAAIPVPGSSGDGVGVEEGKGTERVGPSNGAGGPSPVGQDEADGALAEVDEKAAQGLILQPLLRLLPGRGPEPLTVTPFVGSRGPAPYFGAQGWGC